MAHFQRLHDSLKTWVTEAIPIIQAGGVHQLPTFPTALWNPDGNGNFTRFPQPRNAWLHIQQDIIQALRSWQSVVKAIEANKTLSSQFGQLVGSVYGAQTLDISTIAFSLIPPPDEPDSDFDAKFEERYKSIDDFLAATDLEQNVVFPIHGVELLVDDIQLETNVILGKLSEDEVGKALDAGLLSPVASFFPVFNLPPHGVPCMRLRFTAPKRVGSVKQPNPISTRLLELQIKSQQLFTDRLRFSLALVSNSPTALTGMISYQSIGPVGQSMSYQAWPLRVNSRSNLSIDRGLAAEIKSTWDNLKARRVSRDKTLNLALSRLVAQDQRQDAHDQMLDVIIAAEAIFLKELEGEYRGENRYRLALRLASWIDLDRGSQTLKRKDVYRLMTQAYRIRNSIAHGGVPKQADLTIGRKTFSLDEFVVKVEDVVRQGAKKAVATLAKGDVYPPEWEKVLLDKL